jgi:hypothetical protein
MDGRHRRLIRWAVIGVISPHSTQNPSISPIAVASGVGADEKSVSTGVIRDPTAAWTNGLSPDFSVELTDIPV